MARNEIIEIEGYVIRSFALKETDAIITIISNKGLITIYGASYRSLKSKYHILNNLLLKVKLYGVNGRYFRVMDYDIINSNFQNNFDYDELLKLMKAIDILIKIDKLDLNEEIYINFEELLILFKEDKYEKETLLYIFLAKVLKISGIKLNFSCCNICGSINNLETFSVIEGGLLCNKCSRKDIPKKDIEKIKRLNYLFNSKKIRNIVRKIDMITLEEKREITYLLNESLGVYLRSEQ